MESLGLLFILSSSIVFTKWSLVQVGKKDGDEKNSLSPESGSGERDKDYPDDQENRSIRTRVMVANYF